MHTAIKYSFCISQYTQLSCSQYPTWTLAADVMRADGASPTLHFLTPPPPRLLGWPSSCAGLVSWWRVCGSYSRRAATCTHHIPAYHSHTTHTPAGHPVQTRVGTQCGLFDICKTRGLLATSVRLYIVILACKTRVS